MSFDLLPYDVQGHILSFLSFRNGVKWMFISKVWYQLLREHLFSQYYYCITLYGDNYLQRQGHAAVPYGEDKLILFAGYDGHVTDEQTNELMVYDLKKDYLKHLQRLSKNSKKVPIGRSFFPMCSIGNNEFVVNGGYCDFITEKQLNDTWTISIQNNNQLEWKQVNQSGEIPPIMDTHSLVHYNGYLVLFGGSQSVSDEFQSVYHDIYVMKLETGVWYKLILDRNSISPGNITGHTAHLIEGTNQMILFGGRTNQGIQNQIWILHIVLPDNSKYFQEYSKWELVKPVSKLIPQPTLYHASVLVGDELFIFGGWSTYSSTNQFLAFNYKTRNWRDLSKLVIGRTIKEELPYSYGHTLTMVGNKIVLIGGCGINGYQRNVLVFLSLKN